MRRLVTGALWAVPAYVLGAFGGGYLIFLMSANRHDRTLEAAMTGAFVLGPLAALLGFLVGAVRAKPSGTRPRLTNAGQPGRERR